MPFAEGWMALHLEAPRRVPRTEYSAEFHWDLVHAVTGLEVGPGSGPERRAEAARAFQKAWSYDLAWSTLIGGHELGPWRTRMGHGEYMAGKEDWDPSKASPFRTPEEVLAFDPLERLPEPDTAVLRRRFEEHYRANVAFHDDLVNMTGVYITCVSGLIELFGWELLLTAMGSDPARMGELTDRYCRWIGGFFEALAEADVPVVMAHDDIVWSSGPIFHPDWYRAHVFANYKRMWEPVLASGKRLLFTSDGDYTMFLDDIAACGVHGFVLEPLTSLELAAERYGRTHVLIGNADTRILLSGPESRIRAEVERCMAAGKNCPGYFLAVGNHIPPNTPVNHALAYERAYRELCRR